MINNKLKTLIDFAIGNGHCMKYAANYHYKIEHSTKQREYFEHKRDILLELGFTGWERVNDKVLKGKLYHTVSFNLHMDDDIKTVFKYIVNKGRKAIDKHLLNNLDARSLAYWYMDDGSASKSCKSCSSPGNGIRYYYTYPVPKINRINLYTYAFTVEENQLIINWLIENFDIHAKIILSKRDGPYLTVAPKEERLKFISVVKPYIIPSMQYKIEGVQSYEGIKPINVEQKRLSEEAPHEEDDATV